MAGQDKEQRKSEMQIADLQEQEFTAEQADAVKGGRARAGDDEDDDLSELEVQR